MTKEETTIEDVERQLEQALAKLRGAEFRSIHSALQPLIPQGFRPRVTLCDPKRKKRKNASAKNWSPESDEIRISFKPDRQASSGTPDAKPAEKPATPTPDPVSDLIRALDRAESRPGFDFVALKWFRDVALPAEGFAWTPSDSARHNVLRDAIEKRLILTGRIPNPKSPQFPVTSIRLNRLLPQVQAILGTSGPGGEDFKPVEIRGENLSTTILRDRR